MSAKALLEILLPRFIPQDKFVLRFVPFEGKQDKRKYRTPDALGNPVQELERITNQRYQKVSGSRAIGPLLDIHNNRSPSFQVFVSGVKRLIAGN